MWIVSYKANTKDTVIEVLLLQDYRRALVFPWDHVGLCLHWDL